MAVIAVILGHVASLPSTFISPICVSPQSVFLTQYLSLAHSVPAILVSILSLEPAKFVSLQGLSPRCSCHLDYLP